MKSSSRLIFDVSITVISIGFMLFVVLSGCTKMYTEDQYLEMESQYKQYRQAYLESQDAINALKQENDSLRQEFDAYKKSIEPYAKLSEQEIEARSIEAQKIIDQKKAEEDERARQEEESKAAEEAKGYETGITYDNIARKPDDYKGKKVKFYGKVIQLIEGSYFNQIRVAINGNYDTIILGKYSKDIVDERILEDDVITIYGTSSGTTSYQSTLGGTITVPSVSIDRIER